jgi:hypothetical protein
MNTDDHRHVESVDGTRSSRTRHELEFPSQSVFIRVHPCPGLWVASLAYAAFFGGEEKAPADFIEAIFASS